MSITTGPIVWAVPSNGIFFILVLLAWFFVFLWSRKTKQALHVLANKHILQLVPHFSLKRRYAKSIFLCLGVLSLFISLLRPQWQIEKEERAQEGRDLFIMLDISRSMLANDSAPDRLTVAKNKIKQLISVLDCERVGLVLFSGSAFVQCPLTADKNAFFMFLDQIDVETISSGSTAIDQALGVALEAFKRMPERKNKLVVLFTDGEDFSSNLANIKQDAAQIGMHIVAVGIGTAQGAPIPVYDEHGNPAGHQRDDKGDVVISKLNEGILQSLASDCGGVYVSVTGDNADVQTIKRYVYSFERERLSASSVETTQERYFYFTGFSFICFVLAWLL